MLIFELFKSKRTKFIESFSLYIVRTARITFIVAVLVFIVYFFLEQFKIGLISNYFDLNVLLIIAIITGVLSLLFSQEEEKKKLKKDRYFVISLIFAILIGLVIFQKLHYLGFISGIIAIICTLAIFAIFTLNLDNYD